MTPLWLCLPLTLLRASLSANTRLLAFRGTDCVPLGIIVLLVAFSAYYKVAPPSASAASLINRSNFEQAIPIPFRCSRYSCRCGTLSLFTEYHLRTVLWGCGPQWLVEDSTCTIVYNLRLVACATRQISFISPPLISGCSVFIRGRARREISKTLSASASRSRVPNLTCRRCRRSWRRRAVSSRVCSRAHPKRPTLRPLRTRTRPTH